LDSSLILLPPQVDQCFTGFRLATATGEQSYIKASAKFFAVAVSGGGGPFVVVPIDKPGRFDANQFKVQGHSSAVLDFDWNPFDDNMIASCSDDSTIKVWSIPDGGLTANITEPVVDLRGHGRKVQLVKYNPTVANVLASCSGDQTVKIWDVEKASVISTFTGNTELTNDLAWSHTGDRLATSCKDKHVRIVDARTGTEAGVLAPHEGSKTVKLTYLGDDDHLATVGFTKQSQREMKIWDLRNPSTPLNRVDIDQAAGVILPFFDPDTKIIWLSGKGDGNVRYYEYSDHEPWTFPLAEFRSTISCKGVCVVPKRANNVMKCETTRILKLTPNDGVQPLSFIVPRKSDAFQDDIFPESAAGIAAHTADEWLAGSSKGPVLASLDPAKGGGVSSAAKPAMKTMASVSAELAEANKRIAELEAKLKAAGIDA
jgi:coronin-1B/1C/6